MKAPRRFDNSLALFATLGSLFVISACGGPQARAANPTRSIDERRAVPLIAQALQDEGETPTEGRDITLPSGHTLRIDVGSKGKLFGVAYITRADLGKLDPKLDLPPRNGADLAVVQGSGPDAGAVALVLFDTDYQFDDLVGVEHEATTITAEKKLVRDVHDFVTAARARKLP